MCSSSFVPKGSKPVVEIYPGVEGIEAVYEEILKEKVSLRGYTDLESLKSLLGETRLWGLAERRAKNGIFFYCIAEKDALAVKAQARSERDKREIRFVEGMVFGTETFIAENIIYTLDFASPCGLIIISSAFAKTQQAIWQNMWDSLG